MARKEFKDLCRCGGEKWNVSTECKKCHAKKGMRVSQGLIQERYKDKKEQEKKNG